MTQLLLGKARMFVIEVIDKVRSVIEQNHKRKLIKHKKMSKDTVIEIDNCSPLEIAKLQNNTLRIAGGEGIRFVQGRGKEDQNSSIFTGLNNMKIMSVTDARFDEHFGFTDAESGDGFSDILVETGDGKTGIVIEVKYPDGGDLETGCAEALGQIEKMGYESRLRQDGMTVILKYGIACNRKKCRVRNL